MSKTTRGKLTLSYLAGFFDGEGSICITKINNKRSGNIWYRLYIGCANSERKPIDILHNLFSLYRKVYTRKIARLHPVRTVDGRKENYKPSHVWAATGPTALNFLNIMGPLLIVKKKQAKLAIKFQNWRNSLSNPGKKRPQWVMDKCEEYRQEMKKLNGVIAAATTKRKDTQQGEAIVSSYKKL